MATLIAPAASATGETEDAATEVAEDDSQSEESESAATPLFAEALPLDEAVEEVGESDLVAAVASANGLDDSQAEALIAEQDPTVEVMPSGHISFVDPASEGSAGGSGPDVSEVPGNPQDGSNPDSSKTIYLNFEGKDLQETLWNESEGAETISVGAAELDEAQQEQVWAAVAEDYAPFDVNVVVGADPGDEAIHKADGGDEQYGVEVVIYSGSGGPADGAGGVALLQGFGLEGFNTAWVSVDGTGGGNPLDVGMATAHEAGHTFGLFHDSHEDSDTGYYYPQDPENVWGPIMGSPYGSPLSQWSDASYGGGVTLDGDNEPIQQDDLDEITTRNSDPSGLACDRPDETLYGSYTYDPAQGEEAGAPCGPPDAGSVDDLDGEFRNIFHDRSDYKSDDHGDDTDNATPLTIPSDVGEVSAEGIVGQSDDADYFQIAVGAGTLSVTADPTEFASNLPIDLVVTDAQGNEIGSDIAQDRDITREDDAGGISGLGASFESGDPVEAGVYYVAVQGGTNGDKAESTADVAGGWDRYGSLGNYTVTATATAPDDDPDVEAVSITAPEDGAEISPSGVAVEGSGEPGGTVTLDVDGDEVGQADVGDEGNWSGETGELEPGEHTITATQAVEGAENTTDSVTVTVVEDDDDPDVEPVSITAPEDGAEVPQDGVVVEGAGQPGGTVSVDVDGDQAGETEVDDEGNWSTELDTLEVGERTITATQAVEGEDDTTDSVTVTAVEGDDDDPAVEDVAIISPEDGETITRSGTGVTGSGEPGAEVSLSAGDTEVGTSEVDDEGTWYVETGEQEVGELTLTATQTVEDETSEASVTVTVAPDAPTVTMPSEGDVAESATPSFAGTSDAEAEVIVYLDGDEAGTTTANADGEWEFTPEEGLAEGDHEVSARQVVNEVQSPASDVVQFSVDLAGDDDDDDNGGGDDGDDGRDDNGDGGGDGDDHPDTGANTAGFIGLAAVLLALGGGAILLARRRGMSLS